MSSTLFKVRDEKEWGGMTMRVLREGDGYFGDGPRIYEKKKKIKLYTHAHTRGMAMQEGIG